MGLMSSSSSSTEALPLFGSSSSSFPNSACAAPLNSPDKKQLPHERYLPLQALHNTSVVDNRASACQLNMSS